ncbi:MAG TPA: HAMP domain-containing sensor histidine kinase [Vicinamibacterales bacterium]|nr:HAMP domain-containing sensor histidine kinase [Vicinamibacterales bacterium]
MSAGPELTRSRWYRSFYWRIGTIFVVMVVAVIVAQSVMFSMMWARSNRAAPERSPNNLATVVAADVGSALIQRPGVDVGSYIDERYGQAPWPMFVVMKDGRIAGNRSAPLSVEIRRSVEAALGGTDPGRRGPQPRLAGPVVTAPIVVEGALAGMVVLPPPPPGGILREAGRLLSLPGTLLLVAATALAAFVIFRPARRRLSGLEQAAARFGAGDLAARAPEEGGDEIARVARAFNQMATELEARTQALQTSDRLRRRMLADVSHELKTPLTAMRGFLETLQMPDVLVDTDTRARYLDTIDRETRRLDRIVTDLLDLARHENGIGGFDVRLFAIERVFDHVVRRHERDVVERGIRIRTFVAEDADQVMADPGRIEQVIENLVANALRHTPPGGTVELRAAADRDAIRLSVSDTGEGIAPEHIAHVFDRFYKVDAARAAGTAGSGLGLPIAKAIVERHRGTIEVASQPGRTEFTVLLPQQAILPSHSIPDLRIGD